MSRVDDIGVLGSGPAALAMAAALSRLGASVSLVAPEPRRLWEPNYCLWEDELPSTLGGLVEHRWREMTVATTHGERLLPRPYLKLDTNALQRCFWTELEAGSFRVVPHRATRLDHGDGETHIHTDGSPPVRVRAVIDASGAGSPFVERVHRRAPAFQIAYGVLLEAPSHGLPTDRATLMDFRPAAADAAEPPSFLYLLPLSDRSVFLEETSLAHRPAVSLDLLRSRLQARLDSLGLQRAVRVAEERCSIPMGVGLPTHGQPLVPFGAAASMVHPATGYSIARVLRKAEPVARALVQGLASGDEKQAISAANAELWSRPERKVWELYAFGLETLVSMSSSETSRFFDAFFQLSTPDWSGFLSGALNPGDLGGVMTRLFRNLPASVRWHLVRTGVFGGAAPLARTVLQPGLT